MGVLISFDASVYEVRERLWVLAIEPAFSRERDRARFMWPPYQAELDHLGESNARLALSAHDELIRTVELPLTLESARLAADGIMALFEPEG